MDVDGFEIQCYYIHRCVENTLSGSVGTGRRARLRILWLLQSCGFKSRLPHPKKDNQSIKLWLSFLCAEESLEFGRIACFTENTMTKLAKSQEKWSLEKLERLHGAANCKFLPLEFYKTCNWLKPASIRINKKAIFGFLRIMLYSFI